MKKRKFIVLSLLFLIGFSADFATKQMVMRHVQDKSTITIIDGFLEFSYVENRGMVFGFLNNEQTGLKRYALTALTLFSIIVIVTIIWRLREAPFIYLLPFFLILAGAAGNIIDRIRYGHVIDFIHMHWKETLDYPWLYNIADALVVVGMMILAVLFLFKKDVFESLNAGKKA
ncbi:signal peptidase II [candidate division KSB1 bacterium]|nr:signal peptidase II [candidate division KSB1 bacterium]